MKRFLSLFFSALLTVARTFRRAFVFRRAFTVLTLLLTFFVSQKAQAAATLVDLGTLGGNLSVAYGINDNGQVVGASDTSSGPSQSG